MTHGGKVFFTDINEELGCKTREELESEFGERKVGFCVHDVRSMDSWRQVWDEAETFFEGGGIETLVNNAGVYTLGEWNRNIVDVNLTGLLNGTELALEKMKRGVIVQVDFILLVLIQELVFVDWLPGIVPEDLCQPSVHCVQAWSVWLGETT